MHTILDLLGQHSYAALFELLAPLAQIAYDWVYLLLGSPAQLFGGLRFSVGTLDFAKNVMEGNYLSLFYQIFREFVQWVAKERAGPVVTMVTGFATAIFTLSFMYDGFQMASGRGGGGQDFVAKLVKFYVITGIALGWGSLNLTSKIYDIREDTTEMITGIFIGKDAAQIFGSSWGSFASGLLADAVKVDNRSAEEMAKDPAKQWDTMLKSLAEQQATQEQVLAAASTGSSEGSSTGLLSLRSMAFGQSAFVLSSMTALVINEVLLALALVLAPFFIFCLNFQFSTGYFRSWFNAVLTLLVTYAMVTSFVTLGNLASMVFNLISNLIGEGNLTEKFGLLGGILSGAAPEGGLVQLSMASTIISIMFGLLIIRIPVFVQGLFGSGIASASNELTSRIGALGSSQDSLNAKKQAVTTTQNVGQSGGNDSSVKPSSRADLSTPEIPANTMMPPKASNKLPEDLTTLIDGQGKPLKIPTKNDKNQ